MRRVLLAWELGRGTGHVELLRKIALLLKNEGAQIVVALRDLGYGQVFADMGAVVVQAPAWPLTVNLGSAPSRPATSASMADMLAHFGLAYPVELERMMQAWRALFQAFSIDLVVAEFAPGACVAARGVLPLAIAGTGYTLPPSNMASFPLLHTLAPPLYVPEEVEETVNGVLRKLGGKPISALPQVFEADASFVNTLAVLDPYRAERTSPAGGPLLESLPEVASAAGTGVFAYLSQGIAVPDHLAESLAGLGPQLTAYAPALRPAQAEMLRAAGATCLQQKLGMQRDLKNFALVVHYGVGGTSAVGLLAGVPQLALSLDIEKDLNGQALEELSVGRLIRIHDPKERVSADLIRHMAGDIALGMRARRTARSLRRAFDLHAIRPFIADCMRLAG